MEGVKVEEGIRLKKLQRIFTESYWDPLLISLMGKKQGGLSNF
jgi:hypothetical protein